MKNYLNENKIYLCPMQTKDFNQKRIGLLGGGQLGKMLLQEAYNYNLKISVLDPSADAPCHALCHDFVCGNFKDYDTVLNFGKDKDLITIEFEDVNTDALLELEKMGKEVFPEPSVLKIIRDKGLQKQFYIQNQIPTAEFALVDNKSQIKDCGIPFPVFQKLRESGYDGYGVKGIDHENELEAAFDAPSVIEKKAEFLKEISVIAARNKIGESVTFPPSEMLFNSEANMVEFLAAPAQVSDEIAQKARDLALKVITDLNMTGILAVEMFLFADGSILVNESAPRPHNSGHHTIEANYTSQYEMMLRAILNLPLGNTDTILPAVMVNLLGEKGFTGPAIYEGLEQVLAMKGAFVHLYGKTQTKPFRKMGHVTLIDENLETAKTNAEMVRRILKVKC